MRGQNKNPHKPDRPAKGVEFTYDFCFSLDEFELIEKLEPKTISETIKSYRKQQVIKSLNKHLLSTSKLYKAFIQYIKRIIRDIQVEMQG